MNPTAKEDALVAFGQRGGHGKLNRGSKEDYYANRSESRTLGWRPTCSCNGDPEQIAWDVKMGLLEYEPIPAIVLDPFAGAGTTPLVALQHRRNFFGIELNRSYVEMAEQRIRLVQPRLL